VQSYFVSEVGRLTCAVARLGRRSFNDLTFCRVVIGVLDALAAKSSVPPIHGALLSARKHAIDASSFPNDTPRIVYISLGLSRECRQRRTQCQSGNYRLPHVRLLVFGATPVSHRPPGLSSRQTAALMACTHKLIWALGSGSSSGVLPLRRVVESLSTAPIFCCGRINTTAS
jgi:hypothetical protein